MTVNNTLKYKNHFFYPYAGSKRTEVERIVNFIDLTNIDTIIEPFCGSCALSFYIASLYPNRFKYILNDNDTNLIELLKTATDKEQLDVFIEEVNNKCFGSDGKFISKEYYYSLKKDKTLINNFIHKKYYNIRPTLYPMDKKVSPINIDDIPIVKFLQNENVCICSEEGANIYNKYKDVDNTLIFLDPPYMLSSNYFYVNPCDNIYKELCNDRDIFKNFKSIVVCCLENTWIVQLLFKDLTDKTHIKYSKKYGSHRLVEHIVIKNK